MCLALCGNGLFAALRGPVFGVHIRIKRNAWMVMLQDGAHVLGDGAQTAVNGFKRAQLTDIDHLWQAVSQCDGDKHTHRV